MRSLRTQFVFPTLRSAFADVNRARRLRPHARSPLRDDFRLVHFSVQNDHVHLLVEARDKRALSNALRGLAVSVTRRMNQLIRRRRGSVFSERWHGRALTTPRAVRHALVYVLANFRKHAVSGHQNVDVYSSAPYFAGFYGLRGSSPLSRDPRLIPRALVPRARENPTLVKPMTWLLQVGWLKSGAIPVEARPSVYDTARGQHAALRAPNR